MAPLPEAVRTYAIPPDIAQRKGLRKYGFHGISYAFILRAVAKHLNKTPETTSFIALHLGSGSSAAAVRDGKSIDTSMGLTPASGLPSATRLGDADPTLILHLSGDTSGDSAAAAAAEKAANESCGWKALSGTSDFGQLTGDGSSSLAFEVLVDRIIATVGGYWTKLGGRCDALVFAGGVGENSWQVREEVVSRCACLGFAAVDSEVNRAVGGSGGDEEVVKAVSSSSARTPVLVCRTDEMAQMAWECAFDSRLWGCW